MNIHNHRYPGAQPFSDNEFSQRIFFGRKEDSEQLTNKIISNRTIIVYGRSGLGKTSLLNAGVAPLLRENGYLPLFVRVNNTEQELFHSILEAIPSEASRQKVEYIPGHTNSLWEFFKTAEFWRNDLLLTPVLILDQFEELFTLQSENIREDFLDELSYLIRGVRPALSDADVIQDGLSDRPPEIQIVFSLREDYLGFLEEISDKIPQIFDLRFRLSAFSPETAKEAILGPAAIEDSLLNTKPFILSQDAINGILKFLSQQRTSIVVNSRRYIEPFQLQLVCHRLELIAATKQSQTLQNITITLHDIGGEVGLTSTLKDFYNDAIQSLKDRSSQKSSRRLCEEYLISAEGRRLSIEENEIQQQLGLRHESLKQLVSSRLLRTENRSESTYYELSHDALIEPILASQQKKAQLTGWFGIVSGAILLICSTTFFLLLVLYFVTQALEQVETTNYEILGLVIFTFGVIMFIIIASYILQNSIKSLLRRQHAHEGKEETAINALPRKRRLWIGTLLFGSGMSIMGLGLLLLFYSLIFVSIPFNIDVRQILEILGLIDYYEPVLKNGIGLDLIVYVFAYIAIVLAGGKLIRKGVNNIMPAKHEVQKYTKTSFPSPKKRILGTLKKLLGITFLVSAAFCVSIALLLAGCNQASPVLLTLTYKTFLSFFSLLEYQCSTEGFSSSNLVETIIVTTACLFIAIPMLFGNHFKPR